MNAPGTGRRVLTRGGFVGLASGLAGGVYSGKVWLGLVGALVGGCAGSLVATRGALVGRAAAVEYAAEGLPLRDRRPVSSEERRTDICRACAGEGWMWVGGPRGGSRHRCPRCDGTGKPPPDLPDEVTPEERA